MSVYAAAMRELLARRDLSLEQVEAVMHALMTGALEPAQVAAFLTALTLKGETTTELLGLTKVMRAHALRLDAPGPTLDTCGTGGSGLDTPNTSTLTGLLVAALGVRVTKHGNRSASGRCGSADVLEAAGVPLGLGPEAVSELFAETGFAFLFAPTFHPAMRHAAPVRRALGFRTIFNFLGPLTNPARATRQLLGVSDRRRAELIAEVLAALGTERAYVVTAHDGLDEISTAVPTDVLEVTGNGITRRTIDPASLELAPPAPGAIAGGDLATNLALFDAVLAGHGPPAVAELVATNAAAALVIAERVPDLGAGLGLARAALREGAAGALFSRYRDRARRLGGG